MGMRRLLAAEAVRLTALGKFVQQKMLLWNPYARKSSPCPCRNSAESLNLGISPCLVESRQAREPSGYVHSPKQVFMKGSTVGHATARTL